MTPPPDQSCATCYYRRWHTCRVNPPVGHWFQDQLTAFWPTVEPDDWCGDWWDGVDEGEVAA